MRIILILLGLSLCNFSCNQDIETVKDKQPMCDEIEGLQVQDISDFPKDYSGLAFKCDDGKVAWLFHYKGGQADGLGKEWHKNGQLKIKGIWQANIGPVGLFREWYENGQLKSENDYTTDSKGDLDWGYQKDWHKNGQLQRETNYKDGEETSDKCWDKDGNQISCVPKPK